MNLLFDYLNRQSKTANGMIAFTLICLIGTIDALTGYEIAFSLFYVLPIALVTWFVSRKTGLLASLTSAGVWLWADIAANHNYSNMILIPLWNTGIRLSLFLIIAELLSRLKAAYERERLLSRTDNLTGAFNSRSFFESLEKEIERFHRYGRQFTLVYIDLDNFKLVNDEHGHLAGDQALQTVVRMAHQHLRKTDTVARLGGDEFALLLPESDEKVARTVLEKLQKAMLAAMQQQGWPITFSMGAVSCHAAPYSAEALLQLADSLMYEVKHRHKNDIRFLTYSG